MEDRGNRSKTEGGFRCNRNPPRLFGKNPGNFGAPSRLPLYSPYTLGHSFLRHLRLTREESSPDCPWIPSPPILSLEHNSKRKGSGIFPNLTPPSRGIDPQGTKDSPRAQSPSMNPDFSPLDPPVSQKPVKEACKIGAWLLYFSSPFCSIALESREALTLRWPPAPEG